MKRASQISSLEDFAIEDRREILRDHRAERRGKSTESFASAACSIIVAARPVLIAGAAALTATHAPTLIAEISKLFG